MLHMPAPLDDKELEVIGKIEKLKDALRFMTVNQPNRWTGLLRRNMFARAIHSSNTIEGIHVTADDAIAAAEGDQPLDEKNDSPNWRAVVGYRQAMTYVLQRATDPFFSYSTDLIKSLHFMMLEYDLDKFPGKWRPGAIFIKNEQSGKVVYEGPSGELVNGLMYEYAETLNTPDKEFPPIIHAAMAHLNLTLIHPFKDGNGRMARCLQTLVLARGGTLAPEFSSIEEYLGQNTPDYYQVLQTVADGKWRPERDTRPWIRFCLMAHHQQAMTLLRRAREMMNLWERVEEIVKSKRLPERVISILVDAAIGHRVRNSSYRKLNGVSDQVASRDLKKITGAGLLIPQGTARGRIYTASEEIKKIREATRERKEIINPFSTA